MTQAVNNTQDTDGSIGEKDDIEGNLALKLKLAGFLGVSRLRFIENFDWSENGFGGTRM